MSGGGGRGRARKGDAADVVQRNALRAVCAIIDAFHFVPPGTRLDTAPLLSTDKLNLAEKVAKAGNEDRGPNQHQQKEPKSGSGHPATASRVDVSRGDTSGKGELCCSCRYTLCAVQHAAMRYFYSCSLWVLVRWSAEVVLIQKIQVQQDVKSARGPVDCVHKSM